MELYSGGYFIVRNTYSNNIIPNSYYSASNCINDIIPDTWVWDKTLNVKEIKTMCNLTSEKVKNMRRYTRRLIKDGEFRLPFVFSSVVAAIDFYNRFFSDIKSVKIIGISTTKFYSDELLLEESEYGYGVAINLSKYKSIDPAGEIIGYDLLGFEYGRFHSMYCNDLPSYFKDKLNMHFNDFGLFETLDEAIRAVNIIRVDNFGAEPVLWQPWAIHEFKEY